MPTPTVLCITLVLYMLGILLIMQYNSYLKTQEVQEQITYKVDLAPDIDDVTAKALGNEIAKMEQVKQVDYISKEEAAELFSKEIGDDFVGFLGYNPLYPSLMVNFYPDRIPSKSTPYFDNFCQKMNANPHVTGVTYQEGVVKEVNELFYRITWFCLIFMVLLLIICILMIRCTIKIALHSQRETIRTMRMVGATRHFIARPFQWHSVLYGAMGGLIAIVLIAATILLFAKELEMTMIDIRQTTSYCYMAGGIVILGIAITWISTSISVNRYIKD